VAVANGRPDSALIDALRTKGHRFSFFQAVRLIQTLVPDAAKVGHQGPVEQEAIRFRPTLDFSFAASDVAGIREAERNGAPARYEIQTTFLALYGAQSPLPSYFTENLFEADENSLTRDFLDLFHHRLISLFYRSWEKYRYDVQFTAGGGDGLSKKLLLLLSLDPEALPADHRVAPIRLLGLAGLVTQVPHSAGALRGMLSEFFGDIPFDVEPCVGRWLPIPSDQRNALARMNTMLGRDLLLGERVFDRACTFRVVAGPLKFQDFAGFLPCGDRLPELRELVDAMNGDCLDYEIELILRDDEVPPLQLSGPTARLGWSSWLGRRDGLETRVRFLVKGWFHGRG
jgi:type VI secretion system protein ImpH